MHNAKFNDALNFILSDWFVNIFLFQVKKENDAFKKCWGHFLRSPQCKCMNTVQSIFTLNYFKTLKTS